jgi:hypothetical protein
MFEDLTTKEIEALYQATRAERRKQLAKEEEARALEGFGAPTGKDKKDAFGYIVNGPEPNRPKTRTVRNLRGYMEEIGENEPVPVTTAPEALLRTLQIKLSPEQIERLNPADREAFEKARDEQIELISQGFYDENPSYRDTIPNDILLMNALSRQYLNKGTNLENLDANIDLLFSSGHFTVENLTKAFNALSRHGRIKLKPGTIRPLTADERLKVSRKCAAVRTANDADDVIDEYLRCALGQPTFHDWREYIDNNDYNDAIADAIFFCWENSRSDYSPTTERQNYIQAYLAGRFPSWELLDAAWRSCQAQEQYAIANASPTPTSDDLERLYQENPEEFHRLRRAAIKEFHAKKGW